MMTDTEKSAYRGSLLALLAVFVLVLVAGFIGEGIGRSRSNLEKAEGFIADLQAVATGVPRALDGTILRQGPLSTAWLADTGALPMRLQAMAGSLRGGEDQRTLGLVRRGPWSTTYPLVTRDSLVWVQLAGMPKAVCQQFAAAAAKHPDQIAYISAFGRPAVIPAVQDLNFMCSQNFNNFVVIMLDPATEVRRLSADVQNAIKTMPAGSTEKAAISGSSAPFQINKGFPDLVNKGEDGGPASIQNDGSRSRVTINNVPFAVCRLALLMGPQTFGMDAFETADGTAAPSPLTGPAPEALCTALKGRLVMTRNRAG
jgi:hypothetical protein